MGLRIGVLADDLTGACDSAAPFHARGMRTVVARWGRARWPADAEAVALDTDSRALTAEEAAARVRVAAGLLRAAGTERWLKKVDSTLRGNVGAEIGAALEAGGQRVAVLAPAFPAQGRRVRRGALVVETPGVEATTAVEIRPLVARQLRGAIALAPLEVVERGAEALAEALRRAADAGARLVVADALDEEHLRAIAGAARLLGPACLPVGAAGLARAVAETLPPRAAGSNGPRPRGSTLVLVGSLTERTRGQLALLEARLGVRRVEIGAGDRERDVGEAARRLEQRGLALLATPAAVGADGGAAARALAATALPLLRGRAVTGVVVSGGDTLAALCEALGAGLLELGYEVQAGMPRARLLDGERPGLWLVTKSGGFGRPEALLAAVAALGAG